MNTGLATVLRYDTKGRLQYRRSFDGGMTYPEMARLVAVADGTVIVAGASFGVTDVGPSAVPGVAEMTGESAGYLLRLDAQGKERWSVGREARGTLALLSLPDGSSVMVEELEGDSKGNTFSISRHASDGSHVATQEIESGTLLHVTDAVWSSNQVVISTVRPMKPTMDQAWVGAFDRKGNALWKKYLEGRIGADWDDGPRVMATDSGHIIVAAVCHGEVCDGLGPVRACVSQKSENPMHGDVCFWRYDKRGNLESIKRHALNVDASLMGAGRSPSGEIWVHVLDPDEGSVLLRFSSDGNPIPHALESSFAPSFKGLCVLVTSNQGVVGVVGEREDGQATFRMFVDGS